MWLGVGGGGGETELRDVGDGTDIPVSLPSMLNGGEGGGEIDACTGDRSGTNCTPLLRSSSACC